MRYIVFVIFLNLTIFGACGEDKDIDNHTIKNLKTIENLTKTENTNDDNKAVSLKTFKNLVKVFMR
jgi:hypothetical protein